LIQLRIKEEGNNDDREVFMKGLDYSYYYEGYATYKTDEL